MVRNAGGYILQFGADFPAETFFEKGHFRFAGNAWSPTRSCNRKPTPSGVLASVPLPTSKRSCRVAIAGARFRQYREDRAITPHLVGRQSPTSEATPIVRTSRSVSW